jgi:hypothetical protein
MEEAWLMIEEAFQRTRVYGSSSRISLPIPLHFPAGISSLHWGPEGGGAFPTASIGIYLSHHQNHIQYSHMKQLSNQY